VEQIKVALEQQKQNRSKKKLQIFC